MKNDFLRAGKRCLRWWRPLGYLLLSLFLWWGVGKLLEPWPQWSKTYTDGKGIWLYEDQENGPYLLGMEYRCIAGTGSTIRLEIQILKKQTGEVLYRVPCSDSDQFDHEPPHLHGDVVWRQVSRKREVPVALNDLEKLPRNFFGGADTVVATEHRLLAWNFKEKGTERKVHTWYESKSMPMELKWPTHSNIIVIRRRWPSMLQFWKNPFNPLLSMGLDRNVGNVIFSDLSHDMPCWFETWQLPDSPDQPLQKLAQWPVPYDRIDASWGCSDDGKRIVLMEPEGSRRLAEKRARASGKQVFRGRELFNLYRPEAKGMLVYDSATGKSIQHVQEDFAPHAQHGWYGSYLITRGEVENTTKEYSLNDFSPDKDDTPKPYHRVFSDEYHIYRVDDQGFHPVTIPQHYHDAGVRFYYDGKMLVGRCEQVNELHHYLLNIENNQVTTLNHFQTPREGHLQFYEWLPISGDRQFLAYTQSSWLKRIKDWKGKWSLLDWCLNKVEDHLESSPRQLQVHSDHRTHTFATDSVISKSELTSHLYLVKWHYDELKSITGSSVYAYALPIQLYSPWWARIAALLPWLWLIWKRFRTSRQQ